MSAPKTQAEYEKGRERKNKRASKSGRDTGEYVHPYDPVGPDGKAVRPLSYSGVLIGRGSGGKNVYHKNRQSTHFVQPTKMDDYPISTSWVWSIDKTDA